ncbi:MAG: SAM-dependent methyltransferase, partial [Chloroflexi bacterium]|nr:SAM-dependent methyltransferase [Chloroflexota bacterium]
FDAMPVHRVAVRDDLLRELRVGVGDDGAFVDAAAEPTNGIAERLNGLGVRLTEGHVGEVCLEADRWLSDVGAALASGYLLFIDYGHEAEAYYDASRNLGTLRTYYRHTLGMNPYQNVGRQDISVHVDFTSVRDAASRAGFTDVGATTQAEFLRNLGFDAYRQALVALADIRPAVKAANVHAMDTLVDPEGMGGFKVVAFAKGVPDSKLTGFVGGAPPEDAPPLLAGSSHMPLPGVGQEIGEMPTWGELLR